jgi:hypothetical protein
MVTVTANITGLFEFFFFIDVLLYELRQSGSASAFPPSL